MWRVIHSLLLTTLISVPLALVQAQSLSSDDIRNLDDQVQEIKTDVLDIVAEINRLEERLLFPSGTRLSVSLAIARQEDVTLSLRSTSRIPVIGKHPGKEFWK